MPAESKIVLRRTACLPKEFGFGSPRPAFCFAVTLIAVCFIYFLLISDGVLTLIREWQQKRDSASAKGPHFTRDIVLTFGSRTRVWRALGAVTSVRYTTERYSSHRPVNRLKCVTHPSRAV